MLSYIRVLITFPLLATPLLTIAVKPVSAETVSRAEALELLSKSRSADAKCAVLNEDERQELSDYLAKAEVATVQRSSAAEAESAVSRGRISGESALCGEETAEEVTATLSAARQASAAVKRPKNDKDLEPAAVVKKRLVERAAAARAKQNPAVQALSVSDLNQFGPNDLGRYTGAAMAYYVERRCRHLARDDAQSFWKLIVRQHKKVLNESSKAQVAAALRDAEVKAGARSCGVQTAALVRSAFATMQTK